jgi:hypothetical protein
LDATGGRLIRRPLLFQMSAYLHKIDMPTPSMKCLLLRDQRTCLKMRRESENDPEPTSHSCTSRPKPFQVQRLTCIKVQST